MGWYKRLAELGKIDTLFKIGWLNLPSNKIEAEKWFPKAALRLDRSNSPSC